MHRIAPCAPYLPRRASDTNKYDYGRVLILSLIHISEPTRH